MGSEYIVLCALFNKITTKIRYKTSRASKKADKKNFQDGQQMSSGNCVKQA